MSCCFAESKKNNGNKTNNAKQEKAEKKVEKSPEELKAFESKCSLVDVLDLVNNPGTYINKYVLIEGTFDKYTTLGLDYKPALRSSKDYITFIIRRPDTKRKDHVIPLSELKLMIARKMAETYTSLETGDNVKIYGQVFSAALSDPWVDVDHILSTTKDITATPKNENGDKVDEVEE